MGKPKQVLPFGRSTMLGAVIAAANAATPVPVVVVTGFHERAVVGAVGGTAQTVHNQAAVSGNLSSLIVGLDAVGEVDGVVVLLADMPLVSSAIIDDLASGLLASGRLAGWVAYTDGRAHPVALAADAFDAVRRLEGPRPLWSFLESLRGEDVFVLHVDSPQPIDVNTPEDYTALPSHTRDRQA